MTTVSVLVTSAGVESAVNIIKSLRIQTEIKIRIIATDINVFASGLYLADDFEISPPIKEIKKYIGFLKHVCIKHSIDVIFPCYSGEIELISDYRKEFEKLSIKTLLSDSRVIRQCNDKKSISKIISALEIPQPKTIKSPTSSNLPLFTKLVTGSSSKGAFKVETESHLSYILSKKESRIFQENIEGQEYTVDVLCDKESQVLVCAPRKRLEVKSGQVVKSITVNSRKINNYVNLICNKLRIRGACNIQFIEKENSFYFIEINPRFAAGGLMLTVKAGSNIPLLALKIILNKEIRPQELTHEEGLVMTRYWEEIIINGK